jgi:hypothetical protein
LIQINRWHPGHDIFMKCRRLFDLDMSGFSRPSNAGAPLAPEPLLIELTAEQVHAQLCKTALHASAATLVAAPFKTGMSDTHDAAEVIFAKDGLKITAFNVNHAPVKPAAGYRLADSPPRE